MTPNPPLPVPSKAALRALRGLVLGTSCTLALITEDRRRRINAARSALRNGDRIRSARRYHAGGSALALVLEEDGLTTTVERGAIHWKAAVPVPVALTDGGRRNGEGATRGTKPLEPAVAVDSSQQSGMLQRGGFFFADPLSFSFEEHAMKGAATATATATAAAEALPTASTHSARTPFPSLPPHSTRPIQQHVPSLSQQAQKYRHRVRLPQRPPPEDNTPMQSPAATTVVAVDIPAAVARITKLRKGGGSADLSAAVAVLRSTIPAVAADAAAFSVDQLRPLWTASASLCRACQEAGRMDLAQEVLRAVVPCKLVLDEATYFAHNPLPVVQWTAPLTELKAATTTTPTTTTTSEGGPSPAEAAARRDAFVRQLRDAAALFLPPVSVLPGARKQAVAADVVTVGQQLLECAFAVRHQTLTKSVYASILAYLPNDDVSTLAQWYIRQLQQIDEYERVVWAFLARPPSAGSLTDSAFLELGDGVAKAVRLGRSAQAGDVLRCLLGLRLAGRRLRTAWVTDLLYAAWQTSHDFAAITGLFSELSGRGTAANVSNSVNHANGAYRVVVQIALEADQPAAAQAYFDELVSHEPAAAGDIRLLGLFALDKAKHGDWPGVRAAFEKAATTAAGTPGRLPPRDAERVFVPIAKEYIRTHTIGETEDFLKAYIDELGVPVGRQMVTLLANEYGALREMHSFVGWLQYCARAGFVVDAAFSNAILHNCHKHWKFGFRDLRTLYRKLRVLNPAFEDKVTQRIMTHAAIAGAKHGGHPVKGRVASLRLHPGSAAALAAGPAVPVPGSYLSPLSCRRPVDEDDLYLSMKQAFAAGHPAKVVRLYKHALRSGLPPSEKCLKLAVAAAVRGGGGGGRGGGANGGAKADRNSTNGRGRENRQQHVPPCPPLPPQPADFDAAIDLLQTAHAAGHDVDGATTYIAIAYIDALSPRSTAGPMIGPHHGGGGAAARRDKERMAATVKAILGRLDACGVLVSDLALNRAAFHLFKAGHMRGAVGLALAAADTAVGGHRPGYNVWNFSVLVSAYAQLADADGIRMATAGATSGATPGGGGGDGGRDSGSSRRGRGAVIGETVGYNVLKQARRRLRTRALACAADTAVHGRASGSQSLDEVQAALQAVEAALDQARAVRQRLNSERRTLEQATVAIMQRAALDAGCAPVDFRTVPYLHRQPDVDVDVDVAGRSSSRKDSIGSADWDVFDLPLDHHAQAKVAPVPLPAASVPMAAC
ncbi:hypothetical protein SPI_02917 [Niveomyces insectorum RCEF 264]|uniref:Pentatricopeptide repeat protein n=1 Tax=Niveomyces insectorum RCEF 264 TaxID=1081102 RepID=A0A162MMV1_9HYPO|nr:hypothetical protein SPI_02917 [Niveomyces insectorum RCEF 264]